MKKKFLKATTLAVLLLSFCVSFNSCKKEKENFYGDHTVYLAGTNADDNAVLWINDKEHVLAPNGDAYSVYVSKWNGYLEKWKDTYCNPIWLC